MNHKCQQVWLNNLKQKKQLQTNTIVFYSLITNVAEKISSSHSNLISKESSFLTISDTNDKPYPWFFPFVVNPFLVKSLIFTREVHVFLTVIMICSFCFINSKLIYFSFSFFTASIALSINTPNIFKQSLLSLGEMLSYFLRLFLISILTFILLSRFENL